MVETKQHQLITYVLDTLNNNQVNTVTIPVEEELSSSLLRELQIKSLMNNVICEIEDWLNPDDSTFTNVTFRVPDDDEIVWNENGITIVHFLKDDVSYYINNWGKESINFEELLDN